MSLFSSLFTKVGLSPSLPASTLFARSSAYTVADSLIYIGGLAIFKPADRAKIYGVPLPTPLAPVPSSFPTDVTTSRDKAAQDSPTPWMKALGAREVACGALVIYLASTGQWKTAGTLQASLVFGAAADCWIQATDGVGGWVRALQVHGIGALYVAMGAWGVLINENGPRMQDNW